MRSPKTPTKSEAAAIAATALAFLAEEPDRLVRFIDETGVSIEDLRAAADAPATLAAVLGHVLSDETLLLVFSESSGVPALSIGPAEQVLSGAIPDPAAGRR